MNLKLVEIDEQMKAQLAQSLSNPEIECIHTEEGSLTLAAVADSNIAGFISVYPKTWLKPLDGADAYIDVIRVYEGYRRNGIAKILIAACEDWARTNSYSQIRAWSNCSKIEVLQMWQALGYCMCPAEIWVDWCKEVVNGYYAVKKL